MKRSRDQMTRGTMIALATAQMAIADAGLEAGDVDRGRVGVVLGTTGTGYTGTTEGVDQHRILRNMSNSPAAWVSLKFKFAGPSFVVGTACSSGAYALAAAHWLIASGQADIVITGAADSSLNRLDVQGFSSLMALAEESGRHDDGLASLRPRPQRFRDRRGRRHPGAGVRGNPRGGAGRGSTL